MLWYLFPPSCSVLMGMDDTSLDELFHAAFEISQAWIWRGLDRGKAEGL